MDPRSVLVVLLSLSVASAGAVLPTTGDAATGNDAGDEPENATPITAGTYNGTLFPPGDADWYELSTPAMQPLCSKALVSGAAHADVILSATPGLTPNVTRPVEPGLSLDLGLSTPSTQQILLGLRSPETSSPAPTSAGDYRFEIQTLQPGATDGDAGTGGDAGDDPSTAIATEGPCIDGTVSSPEDRDVYVFDGIEGEQVALSLVEASRDPVLVNLTAPSGAQRTTVDHGGFEDVTLNETGQWIVSTELPGQTEIDTADYMIGMTVNGPEPRPCQPTCMYSTR